MYSQKNTSFCMHTSLRPNKNTPLNNKSVLTSKVAKSSASPTSPSNDEDTPPTAATHLRSISS